MVNNLPTERLKKNTSDPSSKKWKIRHYLKPGDVGYLTYLHGILYSKEYGYDQTFEAYVANGLVEFVQNFSPDKDRIWLAEINNQIIGSIAIVKASKHEAQLRWFLVHPNHRGLGLGRELIKATLQFCKEHGYKTIFLWTTSELNVARYLYLSAGFRKTEEKTHQIWGKTITEERYDLHLRKAGTLEGANEQVEAEKTMSSKRKERIHAIRQKLDWLYCKPSWRIRG